MRFLIIILKICKLLSKIRISRLRQYIKRERGPLTYHTFNRHLPLHFPHKHSCNIKPKSYTLTPNSESKYPSLSLKLITNHLRSFCSHPYSSILYKKFKMILAFISNRHYNFPKISKFYRIRDKIQQNLRQTLLIRASN